MGKRRDLSNRRAGRSGSLLLATVAAKFLIVILAGVICGLLSGVRPNSTVSVVIVCCAVTVLYNALSIMVAMGVACRCPNASVGSDVPVMLLCRASIREWFLTDPGILFEEIVGGVLLLGFWLTSCGMTINTAANPLNGTQVPVQQFGWIGACCGLNSLLYLGLIALYCIRTAAYFVDRE